MGVIGDHPVQLSQRLQQRCALLQPRPRQGWLQTWGRGRVPHVLCEFLGAGLVPRPVKLNEVHWDDYCVLLCHYYIFTLLLLRIIPVDYYVLLHYYYLITTYYCNTIITYYCNAIITHYSYCRMSIVSTRSLLRHYFVIITYYCNAIITYYYDFIITTLLHHYYVIITLLLRHYYKS